MIILDLPFPVSANVYYRHARGRHYISPKGAAFREAVKLAVKLHHVEMMRCRIELGVMLYPPDRRVRDLDNFGGKSLNDALTYSGLIEDDSLIDKLTIERGAIVKGGKCRIYLSEYKQQDDIT
jgi:crossover junction endodeoxyribonuclease RusA